jgi:hypothetical protein
LIRRWVFRAALGVLATVLALLASELALRLLTGERWLSSELRLRTTPYSYEPNQVSRHKHREWDVEFRINGRGFRDEDSCPHSGADDIVVLGDSFVDGYGVAFPASFPQRLEARFVAARKPCHVYNGGHVGCQTLEEISIYTHGFENAVPHRTVILGFYVGNDLVGGGYGNTIPVPKRDGLIYLAKCWLGENVIWYNLLNNAARSWRPLRQLLVSLHLMEIVPEIPEDMTYSSPPLEAAARFTSTAIADLGRRVRARGRAFHVVVFPTREQASDAAWETMLATQNLVPGTYARFALNDRMVALLRAADISVIDLSRAFIAPARTGKAYYFVTDRHFNPAGHDLAAALVARALGLAQSE